MTHFLDVVNTFGTAISGIAGASAAYFALKAFSAQSRAQTQTNNLQGLNQFIISAYVSREPITYSKESGGTQFIDDRANTRQEFITNPQAWQTNYSYSAYEPSRTQIILNEISHSLQHLGLAVFVGILPLKLLLANVGDTLILDWLIVRVHTGEYQSQGGLYSTRIQGQKLYARRRHSEWIALIAFLWLRKNWHYQEIWNGILNEVLEHYKSIKNIEFQIKSIAEADKDLLAASTKKEVYELLKLDLCPTAGSSLLRSILR